MTSQVNLTVYLNLQMAWYSSSQNGRCEISFKFKACVTPASLLLISNKIMGSISVSGQLPTYPSPNPTFTLTCYQLTNVGLGEGQVGSCPDTDIDPNNASNSLTLRGDKHVTSPYNIHTLSNKQVMRTLWVEIVILIPLQILLTNLLGNVYQLEGRICGHILGVKV